MNGIHRTVMTAALIAVAYTNQAQAQSADSAMATGRNHAIVRVSKWTTLGVSLGAAAYGFAKNRSADSEYEALERQCAADVFNCRRRVGSAYADAAMEQQYQDVLALDNRARTALLGSQIGIAAAVALFIYDLRDNRPPRDIPYKPRAMELVPGNNGAVQLRFTLPLPVDKR